MDNLLSLMIIFVSLNFFHKLNILSLKVLFEQVPIMILNFDNIEKYVRKGCESDYNNRMI